MANTSFSSGFGTGYSITSQWKAKKEKKDAIKKQEEQAKTFALDLGARFDRDRKSGLGISQEEYENGYMFYMGAGEEVLNLYKDLYKSSMDMTNEELENNLADAKDMQEMYADVDLKDYDAIENIINTWKSPRARAKGEVLIKKWKAEDIAAAEKPEVEVFTSYAEATQAKEMFPNAIVKFNASKGIYYLEGTKPSAPTKESSFEEHMKEQDRMLEAGEITFDEWKKDRRRLAGGAAPTGDYKTTPLPALQKMEQSMLDAGTWEEADNMLRQWTGAEYNPEDVKVRKAEWTDYQTKKRTTKIENTIKTLEKMLGESGTLRGDEEYEMPVGKKTVIKTKADWYEALYEQYRKQVEALGTIADIEEFKKLIPPEELKKVGYYPNQWGKIAGDVMGSDWRRIWQE